MFVESRQNVEEYNDFYFLIDRLNSLAKIGNFVFRGYGKQDELLPNIVRKGNYENIEKQLLEEFEKYGSNYFRANTPIDFMSYAQHFGLPTRLLDFTYNPFIALSFALYMPKGTNYKEPSDRNYYYIRYAALEENLCVPSIPLNDEIYNSKLARSDSLATRSLQCIDSVSDLFSKNIMNRNIASSVGFKDTISNSFEVQTKIKSKVILFIDPNQSNQRIIMQQGLFMFPYTLNPQEHLRIIKSNTSLIMIHKNLRNDLLSYLNTLGYNAFRLMPDLSSICEAVTRKVMDERTDKSLSFKVSNSI